MRKRIKWLLACVALHTTPLVAADPPQQAAPAAFASGANIDSEQPLEVIIITGSLIPQASAAADKGPTTVITADDFVNKGYTSLANALQSQVYATGGVAEGPESGGYTQGAHTLSMFGLSPGYTKYLIDGLPMADYPALYGGTDVITNISGVPEYLIDHVDIVPGGQSSLYGSDAIAGVVNVIMKKRFDTPVVTARMGGFKGGGGTYRTITLAGGHTFGETVGVMGGIEFENTDPIWGYQRELTASYHATSTGPAVAQRDWMILLPSFDYAFADPANCANVASQFGGSTAKQSRQPQGDYCGTFKSGYGTINDGGTSTNGYLRVTADLGAKLQLYADGIIDHESTTYGNGSPIWFGPSYYDPTIGDISNWQRFFSPEEIGGFSSHMNSANTDAWRGTVGAQGQIGHGGWTYDVGLTYAPERLTQHYLVLLTAPADRYFGVILGPVTGTTPDGNPIRSPDYAKFYSPVSQAQFAGMSGMVDTQSRTDSSVLRGQLTSASLFALPGGPAGVAFAAEAGNQDWRYTPDERLTNGDVFGRGDISGNGRRSRYALTGEIRLPLEAWLTVTGSTRYDSYHVTGESVSANTYDLGIELRPAATWLLRGRMGTAFKAPTLADEFQGQSHYFTYVTDYYACAQYGIPSADCADQGTYEVVGTTSGNSALQPIRANVSSVGTVWNASAHFQISMDYLHWNIRDEVTTQDPNLITRTEDQCHRGVLDIKSPACIAALGEVVRGSDGFIASVFTPKINVSEELVNAFVTEGLWRVDLGEPGNLELHASWTDMLTHTYRVYPMDPRSDALNDPTVSTDFKSRLNGAATWNIDAWTSTISLEHFGATPNYAASNGLPGAGSLHPWTLTDVTVRYRWSHELEFGVSVQNLFNVMPPEDRTYPAIFANQPYNAANYSVYGMSYYAHVIYRPGS